MLDKLRIPSPEEALPGRSERMPVAARHAVLGAPMQPPWPEGHETAVFGLVVLGGDAVRRAPAHRGDQCREVVHRRLRLLGRAGIARSAGHQVQAFLSGARRRASGGNDAQDHEGQKRR